MSTRAPHLCFVVHTLNPGGTERLAVDMAAALHRDYSVSVICLDEPGAWADELRQKGVEVVCVWRQPGFDPGVARRIARHCREHTVDLLHAHQCTPWFYAALSRTLYRRPRLLLEEHGRFYPEADKPLKRWINRWLSPCRGIYGIGSFATRGFASAISTSSTTGSGCLAVARPQADCRCVSR